jgi:hypothetical protein
MKWMSIAAIFAALCGAPGLEAAGPEQNRVTARVPFAFTAGDAIMPAGDYTIAPGAVGLLWIREHSWRNSANVLVIPAHAAEPRAAGILVFHKYGRRYFLREVWKGGLETGAQIPVSRTERELLQAAVPERVHVAVARFR